MKKLVFIALILILLFAGCSATKTANISPVGSAEVDSTQGQFLDEFIIESEGDVDEVNNFETPTPVPVPINETTFKMNSSDMLESIVEDLWIGCAAGVAHGFYMNDIPSWDEVKAAREANPNYPNCYWAGNGLLHTEVDGEIADLTPDDALDRYGSNADFMREYKNLIGATISNVTSYSHIIDTAIGAFTTVHLPTEVDPHSYAITIGWQHCCSKYIIDYYVEPNLPQQPLSVERYWLLPDETLRQEERDFRRMVIEMAGLDSGDQDFAEQLTSLYTAEWYEDYPTEELYELFQDHPKYLKIKVVND